MDENLVKNFADRVAEYKTKKTRPTTFSALIRKEFNIARLTDSRKNELKELFGIHSLRLLLRYSDTEVDWATLDVHQLYAVKYIDQPDGFAPIYDREIETPAIPIFMVEPGGCPKKPRPHQVYAIKKMDDFYLKVGKRKGLLVLPTGGGKTFTALYWLLKNVINKQHKVIWIAHRHELLEQAKEEIHKLCYSNLLPDVKSVRVHIISGYETHHNARKISRDDDVIIASKDSLRMGRKYLNDNFLKHNKEVYLVIDEAHHAVARTYRELIGLIEQETTQFRLLGLTATPFRTAESEQTFLAKVFTDGIIYKTDLSKLIIEKILARPILEQYNTNEVLKRDEDFSEKDLKLMNSTFDLPENLKSNLALRKNRNNFIAGKYDKLRYGKTLVFALNKDHAVTLDALFRQNGARSKFIISGGQDGIGTSVSAQANKQAIEEFRKNELDILVNVNILTEGTDLPDANSVFLTRPTTSKTLLTQMIGRVLRGPKAGGTPEANIVSFIDDWQGLISWVSPAELLVDEIDILDSDSAGREKGTIEFISIKLLQQFAMMLDSTVDNSDLKALTPIQRIPVGWYSFQIQQQVEHEEYESKVCKILVFENYFLAFRELEVEMEDMYQLVDVDKNNKLDEHEREFMLKKIKARFFDNCYSAPSIQDQDLMDIIEFYDQTRLFPSYYTFAEREKVDVARLVALLENKSRIDEARIIADTWGGEDSPSIWKDLYNNNFNYFLNEIQTEQNRRLYGNLLHRNSLPQIILEKEKLSDIPLTAWPEPYQQQMRDEVFRRAMDKDGNYVSAISGFRSKNRKDFHIDHINPFSKGVNRTVLENLRVITREENLKKGDYSGN